MLHSFIVKYSQVAKFLQLNDIDAYKRSYKLSNLVWKVVTKWDSFAKNTIGNQYVRAIDSISANIAEGFGRHFKKEKILFYRIAKGSVTESLDWTLKAKDRRLLEKGEYEIALNELNGLLKYINQLISFTRLKLKE